MIKRRRRFSFDLKSLEFLSRREPAADDHFEGSYPVKLPVSCFVDDSHPATCNFFDYLVVSKLIGRETSNWARYGIRFNRLVSIVRIWSDWISINSTTGIAQATGQLE